MGLCSSFQIFAIIITITLANGSPQYQSPSYSTEDDKSAPPIVYARGLNDDTEVVASDYDQLTDESEAEWRNIPDEELEGKGGFFETLFRGVTQLISEFLVSVGTPGLSPKSASKMRYLVRKLGPFVNYTLPGSWISIGKKGYKVEVKDWHKGGPLKVLIHGFTPSSPWETFTSDQKMIAERLFILGNAFTQENPRNNIVIVDWTSLSTQPYVKYYEAADAVRYAAKDLAKFLIYLKKKRKLIADWKDVHIIGFSLGAHVSGGAGFRISESQGGVKIGRITGLDPAGPFFHEDGKLPAKLDNVLDPEDAEFVDVIHCNMGWETFSKAIRELNFDFGNYGTPTQCGHADFYPNGGISQEGCSYLTDKAGCSHGMCRILFHDSIHSKVLACPCTDWEKYKAGKCHCSIGSGGVYLGYHVDKRARGRYYLK